MFHSTFRETEDLWIDLQVVKDADQDQLGTVIEKLNVNVEDTNAWLHNFFPKRINSIKWNSEKAFEESFYDFLNKKVKAELQGRIIEQQRTNEDRSRTDIIISLDPRTLPSDEQDLEVNEFLLAPKHDKDEGEKAKKEPKLIGRPGLIMEIKVEQKIQAAKKPASEKGSTKRQSGRKPTVTTAPKPKPAVKPMELSDHLHQILHYVKELLCRHCGIQKLPFLIISPRRFYIGLAEWENFHDLSITVGEKPYDFYKEDGKLDLDLVKRLQSVLSYEITPRSRYVAGRPGGCIYKLIRVIGRGASSTVYQAEVVKADPETPTKPPSQRRRLEIGKKVSPFTLTDGDSADVSGAINADFFLVESHVKTTTAHASFKETPVEKVDKKGPRFDFALKISNDIGSLVNELTCQEMLAEKYRIGWESSSVQALDCYDNKGQFLRTRQFFIVGPLLSPAKSALFKIPNSDYNLKWNHYLELIENVASIHKSGLVHRDIRLPNILFKGDTPLISDFGFATFVNIPEYYEGSKETASQRISELLCKDRKSKIKFLPEDDLESAAKMIVLVEKPWYLDGCDDFQSIHDKWIEEPFIRAFLLHSGYESKLQFLRQTLSRPGNLEK